MATKKKSATPVRRKATGKVNGTTPTGDKQRKIQAEIDAIDAKSAKKKESKSEAPIQTGSRKYPGNPFPKQHHRKPGHESEITPRPMYDNPDYKGSGKLEGKVALITGGDSGIGRAVAVFFAREGADVAIVYLESHADAEETRRVVEEVEGKRCLVIASDVTDPARCEAAVQQTVDELGKLDILVNNAAFQQHTEKLDDLTEEHFDLTMKTNIYGYFHMTKAALPHLGRGSAIVNNGSETGLFGQPVLLDYSATKGAIHAFTKALATNLAPKGIRVNAVAPGPVWTPLNPADQPADHVAKFGHKTSLQRPAQPEEIAPAFVFLASPVCSSYITGVILPVMGGVTGAAGA